MGGSDPPRASTHGLSPGQPHVMTHSDHGGKLEGQLSPVPWERTAVEGKRRYRFGGGCGGSHPPGEDRRPGYSARPGWVTTLPNRSPPSPSTPASTRSTRTGDSRRRNRAGETPAYVKPWIAASARIGEWESAPRSPDRNSEALVTSTDSLKKFSVQIGWS